MANNGIADFRKLLKKIPGILEKQADIFADIQHKKAIEDIVENFDTTFPVDTVKSTTGGSITYNTNVEDVSVITPLNTATDTRSIFYFLNSGTSIRYAAMPSDFSNETFPGTTYTISQQYDRKNIYYDPKGLPGIDARNWIEIIAKRTSVLDYLGMDRLVKLAR